MTPEQQRIAIAEACGWKDCDINRYQNPPLLLGDKPTWHRGKIVSYLVDQRIPDYLNNLNEMHDALVWLEVNKPSLCKAFIDELRAIKLSRVGLNPGGYCGEFRMMAAGSSKEQAAMQAEAVLRAIGMWKD